MLDLVWSLLPIIFLAMTSGCFLLMETSITESSHGRLEKLAQDGNRNAEIALSILDSPQLPLSAAKIGIMLSGILAGFYAVSLSRQIFLKINFFPQAEVTSLGIALFFAAFVMILFGGFLPVYTARQSPENFLLSYHKSFRLLVGIMTPAVKIFSVISKSWITMTGENPETSDTVTEDKVKDLIDQGTEDGTFEESEREMVDKIFHLSDQTAYALMTPRVHIVWLDLLDSAEKNLKIVRESRQTVFPVGEGSLDECRGVIYAKDLLDAALDKKFGGENFDLRELMKKPLFIPRTMETFRVVEKFKSGGDSAAIVNDEYGGVVGLITPNDIAREVVGLNDTEQPEDRQFLAQKDNSWTVDGLCSVDDFKKKFNFDNLPDEERDHFQTMGGFLTSRFGYIPKVGETKDWNGLRFEVLKMDRARIDKISIKKIK